MLTALLIITFFIALGSLLFATGEEAERKARLRSYWWFLAMDSDPTMQQTAIEIAVVRKPKHDGHWYWGSVRYGSKRAIDKDARLEDKSASC